MTANDPQALVNAPVEALATARRRIRAHVEGTVQGVGFRPHIHRLVTLLGLDGFVRNDERGVVLEVEGDQDRLGRFLERLQRERPPLATVDAIAVEDVPAVGKRGFQIVASARGETPSALVSADTATCDDCLRELFDPADRRYRYPFINCTNCGPRFTIVESVPYDRAFTTMSAFEMCAECSAEYHDPSHRRFHAQPNACPRCGPRVRLTQAAGGTLCEADDAIRGAAQALRDGLVVAVKGLGGFHLACRADADAAVSLLRARKGREKKAFAIMVRDLPAARLLCHLDRHEEQVLLGRDRPILLAARRTEAALSASVAPGLAEIGVMLPYTPLHHVLLTDLDLPLVLTSGNLSNQPITFADADAGSRLAGLADLFLTHDRRIHAPADDSIVRAVRVPAGSTARRRTVSYRRSRGHVPMAIELPISSPRPILACGAELKSTFCLVKGNRAWISQHLGDLTEYQTLEAYAAGIEQFQALFAIDPEVIVHDLHPDYLSTSYAEARECRERLAIQHHHAHFAAVLAEHGEVGPAVGVIFDGAGYGASDGGYSRYSVGTCSPRAGEATRLEHPVGLEHSAGTSRPPPAAESAVWGGELLIGTLEASERVGHLWPVRLPGGDRAARQPWRMACAWLTAAQGWNPEIPPGLVSVVSSERWRAVCALIASGVAAPWTTSVGRLFDAVAVLCGICLENTYEGQAAMELEAISEPRGAEGYPIGLLPERIGMGTGAPVAPLVMDARSAIRAVTRELAAGVRPGIVAARFHDGMAQVIARAGARLACQHAVETVVLSGGAFQNHRLLITATDALEAAGLRVLSAERVPPNDGGIAFGQAAAAAAIASRQKT